MTFKQFAQDNKVTITTAKLYRNETGDNYTVTLHHAGRKLVTPYFKGIGHKGKAPTVDEVLYCLQSDAQCSQDTFESFCSDMGYNPDSRKYLEMYLACQRNGSQLRKLMGAKYDALMECEE